MNSYHNELTFVLVHLASFAQGLSAHSSISVQTCKISYRIFVNNRKLHALECTLVSTNSRSWKKIPHFAYTTNKRQTTVANESAVTSNNHFFTHPLHNRRTLGYNDKGVMARYQIPIKILRKRQKRKPKTTAQKKGKVYPRPVTSPLSPVLNYNDESYRNYIIRTRTKNWEAECMLSETDLNFQCFNSNFKNAYH